MAGETLDIGATQQQDAPQDEQLIAGKFKTQDDLVNAYKALETKLGQGSQQSTTPEPKQTQRLELDFSALSNEILAHGDLSPETRSRLDQLGFPQAMIDAQVTSVKGAAAENARTLHEAAGGEEQYKSVKEWAKSNLPQAEKDFLEGQASMGREHAAQAVKYMVAKYEAANGKVAPLMQGGGGTSNGSGYPSVHAMKEAMADKRYGKDPDYTQSVMNRVAVSTAF